MGFFTSKTTPNTSPAPDHPEVGGTPPRGAKSSTTSSSTSSTASESSRSSSTVTSSSSPQRPPQPQDEQQQQQQQQQQQEQEVQQEHEERNHGSDPQRRLNIDHEVEYVYPPDDTKLPDQPKLETELLTKEMMSLSLLDRNAIQEEIHGVQCLCPEETPTLVQESLKALQAELERTYPHSVLEKLTATSYLQTDEMRLQFLRNDLFDPIKAAKRMDIYLEALVDYFGPYALERPIKLTDFTKDELKHVRKGYLQILPFRDRSGRRTSIFFQGNETQKLETRLMMKMCMYVNFVISYKDAEAQRKGVTLIIWIIDEEKNTQNNSSSTEPADTDPTTLLLQRIHLRSKMHACSMTRASAIHMCTPDTPMCRLRRSLMTNGFGSMRSRIKLHCGEPMELRYILQGFGIDTNNFPISWTGTIKSNYQKQWIWTRKYIEDNNYNCSGTCVSNNGSAIVECPELKDIIFKKGAAANAHPGNVIFRSMIQMKYEQCPRIPTKSFIKEIIQEIRDQRLRMLIWNDDHSWWSLLEDEKQIYKKLEYIVRDFRFSSKKSQTINRGMTQQADATSPAAVTARITKTKHKKKRQDKIAAADALVVKPSTTASYSKTIPGAIGRQILPATLQELYSSPVSPVPQPFTASGRQSVLSSLQFRGDNNSTGGGCGPGRGDSTDASTYVSNTTVLLRSDTSMFLQDGQHRKRFKSGGNTNLIGDTNVCSGRLDFIGCGSGGAGSNDDSNSNFNSTTDIVRHTTTPSNRHRNTRVMNNTVFEDDDELFLNGNRFYPIAQPPQQQQQRTLTPSTTYPAPSASSLYNPDSCYGFLNM